MAQKATISNVAIIKPPEGARCGQDESYRQAAGEFGRALERLAYAYESDPDHRRDLTQEIHLALWRSFEKFDGRCSLRTWTYRVAHNVATSHVIRQSKRRRNAPALLSPWKKPKRKPAMTMWRLPPIVNRRSHVCWS